MTRRALGVVPLVLVAVLVALGGFPGSAGASDPHPIPYDLAVGGSGSVGFQPTFAHPRGQATAKGYADDLAAREAARWPGLTLVRIGCPGITTQTMLNGAGHCRYSDGSQLESALAFLRDHPSTVLVTLDLGFLLPLWPRTIGRNRMRAMVAS